MIEDVKTGNRIVTVAQPVVAVDLLDLGRGWNFDWIEIVKQFEVFKLINPAAQNLILGLIALERHDGSHVEVTHLESNPGDVGRTKTYRGIPGSLLAHAALISLSIGGEGFVSMSAKHRLIGHYRDVYGFTQIGNSQRMYLDKSAAAELIRIFTGDQSHGQA